MSERGPVIVDVRTHVLLDPGFDPQATSSAQDTIVVEIESDDGLVGVGETDLNAWIARACIESPGTHTMDRGLKQMLIGREAADVEAIWQELYVGSAMSGRRGAVVHALGALDIALWDLRGKSCGLPCWRLWTDCGPDELTPYASLQPEDDSYDVYLESMVTWAQRASAMGFRAVKLEATFSGPYVHKGLIGPDERVTEVITAVREAVGRDVTIMVDVQYAFDSTTRALRNIERWAELDIFFVEAPLWPDDLDAYAELSQQSPVRIAAGEWLSSRHEFAELISRGRVAVVQPDVGRVGGFTEARRVCAMAAEQGRLVVPHAWKTGISVAVAAHLAMVTPHMPFFEFLPAELCNSRLRRELVRDELIFTHGRLGTPQLPGLGVELNTEALGHFAAAAKTLNHATTRQ